MILNISYQDLISFLQCYLLNNILIKKINSINEIQQKEANQLNENLKHRKSMLISVATIIDSQKNSLVKLKLCINNIFFTLIDNSSGSYQPFINGELSKFVLNSNRNNYLEFTNEFSLCSYNYISSKWEPIIENTLLKLNYIFAFDPKKIENKANLDINEININLSDMAICSILIILQHWENKFIEDNNYYSKIKSVNITNTTIINNEVYSKMSNTSVINYTGMDLLVKYNKSIYKLATDSKIDLEYIIDWDINKLGAKQISIFINNDYKKEFKIFFEKLGKSECIFNSNYMLVAENTLTKDRHINISIYSPIIIKNKTMDKIQVKLINSGKIKSFNLFKPNNKIIGINNSFYNSNTVFSLNLIGKNDETADIKFHLKDFILNDDFSQSLLLGGKTFLIKLIKKFDNLKEILITFQYCIVNGLPCELILENKRENKSITIKKFTQYFVDFYSDLNTELEFKIKIGEEYFYSIKNKYFKINMKQEGGNNYYTTFSNKDKSKSFRLAIQFNKTKNTKLFIIYSESFLYNYSGVDFNINSQNEGNPFLFKLDSKLYLISSKLDNIKNAWIQLRNKKFISDRILLDDIIQANPYNLKMINNNNILNLSIKKEMSYIAIRNNPHFKESIMTMIYKIYPFCRITNLLTSKHIIIAEENNKNNYVIINTFKEICFNFFDKGKNLPLLIGLLNIENNQCSPFLKFKLQSYGIFSFCIENTLFNIEIKESNISGFNEIFFIESNLDNAKIVVENLSKNNFIITQEGYDFRQILLQNEKQILRIYDQNCNNFILKDSKNNKSYRYSFKFFEEEENKKEINDLLFIKESNAMKMKLTILNKNSYNQIKNCIMNVGLNLKINKIFISLIGDNEFHDKKLRNYERHELLLIKLDKTIINFHLEHYSSLLDIDKFNLKFFLGNMVIYNQISKFGKYSNVLKNISDNTFNVESEIIDYKNSSISKINKFLIKVGKLKLSIDPNFIEEIFNFGENIFYRMEIINFNVDEIFLHKDRDYIVKKQFENYQKDNSIYYGTKFLFPAIDINFELDEVGLDKLLREKGNASPFLVWLGNGLVGSNHNIYLTPPQLRFYSGNLQNLLKKIILMYKDVANSEVTKIGLKGILGQIEQFFTKSNKTNKECTEVQK